MPDKDAVPHLVENGSKHYEAAICAEHHTVLRVAVTADGRRLWVEPCPECMEDS